MRYNRNKIYSITYLFLAVILWPYLKDYVNNSDSYQYINVARLYASGYFSEAINGYWSPLISWLLLPFFKTDLTAVEAFKGLQLAIGLVALRTWQRLVDQFTQHPLLREPLKVVALPLFLSYAYLFLTADLLFFTLQLLLLSMFTVAPVWTDTKRAFYVGLLGGLLYLSKAFGLPLFIGVVIASLFFHHRHSTIRWKTVAVSLSVFSAIAALWITAISNKYDHFTISEAARFNNTREVAPLPGQLVRLPVLYTNGILPPVGAHALSASEEPMQALTLTPLQGFNNYEDRQYRWRVMERNILSIWYFDFRRQLGLIVLLFLVFVFIVRKEALSVSDPQLFYPAAFISLTYLGYALILYHARYSWICTPLFLLLITRISDKLIHSEKKSIRVPVLLFFSAAILITMKRPVKELLLEKDKDVSAASLVASISRPLATMDSTYSPDKAIAVTAEVLRKLDGSFASRYSDVWERPPYYACLAVAERSGQRYFGQLDDTQPGALDSLRHFGVSYFLVWNNSVDSCFGRAPVIKTEHVRVFDVR